MAEIDLLLPLVRELHGRIRTLVRKTVEERSVDDLSQVVAEQGGDVIFAIDQVVEQELIEFVSRRIATLDPVVLIAEGLPEGKKVLPAAAEEADCRWRMIVDPIDGTRCLTHQKRSGWILTGIAPNRGDATSVQDIELAVQTELPLVKQYLCDQLWAIRGQPPQAERLNLLSGKRAPLELQPAQAETLRYGYSSIGRFFPGCRDVLAAIDDELMVRLLGPVVADTALVFEDQYPSTGGQLFSLSAGADRFLADLRPLMKQVARARGEEMGHCCHPYDICTLLIAEGLGVAITDAAGNPLDVPLDVTTDVAWVGYANATIQGQVEPVLQAILRGRGIQF